MKLLNYHKSFFDFISILLSVIFILFSFCSVRAITHQNEFVAVSDSFATKIAEKILSEGGNAVDAGIAAMFALTVVEPFTTGLGGGGFILIHNQHDNKTKVIDFRETTPISVDPDIYYQSREDFDFYSSKGWGSICVPGMVAGANEALTKFGSKSFEQILNPVIQVAEQGFLVSESLSKLFIKYYDLLEENRNTSETFFPNLMPMNKGEIMKRDDLALTFKLLSKKGAEIFYNGEIAEKIVSEMKSKNAMIRSPDLSEYTATIDSSVTINYKGFQIHTVPIPSCTGIGILELLKILAKMDIKKHSQNSGHYIHVFVEACKIVLEDRTKYQFQKTNSKKINYNFFLSEKNIKQVSQQIDSLSIQSNKNIIVSHNETRTASHISIIDKDGNAFSASLTMNNFFGSGIILEKYGVLFNNAMNNFSWEPNNNNSIKPGRRPQTSLAPIIVLKNKKPFLVIGGSGGERIISTLAQIIINILDFKMTLNEAIMAPRFSYNNYTNIIELESRIDSKSIDYLKKMGHKIKLMNAYDIYFGNTQSVMYDSANQEYSIMNDVRKEELFYIDR